LASLVWLVVLSFPDNKLHVVFCNVGQGDAALIFKGFNQILIDGGPNDKVLECLANNMPITDKKIEMVIMTHPEADHMTGLVSVLEKYEVSYFLSGPEGNRSAIYSKLISILTSRHPGKRSQIPDSIWRSASRIGFWASQNDGVKVINPYFGDRIKLGDIILETLWPEKEWLASKIQDCDIEDYTLENCSTESNQTTIIGANTDSRAILGAKTGETHLNDFSLIFLLRYNGKTVLFMGDADQRVDNRMIGLQELVNSLNGIDILKFPHHGSKTGITEKLLEEINPRQVVISVGKNSFGHPTKEALDMLEKFNVIIRRTDIEGDIKYEF